MAAVSVEWRSLTATVTSIPTHPPLLRVSLIFEVPVSTVLSITVLVSLCGYCMARISRVLGPEQEGAADAEAQRERPFLAGHSGGSAMSRACRMTMSIAWVLGLGMPCSCRTLSQYDSATRRALRISHEAARR